MARKARELIAIKLRLPVALHRKLVRSASDGARSLNAELIRRLQQSIATDEPLPPEVEKVLARVEGGMQRRDRLEAELLGALLRVAPKELKKILAQVYGGEES
jgi:hypothetical protein